MQCKNKERHSLPHHGCFCKKSCKLTIKKQTKISSSIYKYRGYNIYTLTCKTEQNTFSGEFHSWSPLCSVAASACGSTVSTVAVFTLLTGTATTVLPPTGAARFCPVAPAPTVGSVTSWNGLSILTIVGAVDPCVTAAVLNTVKLEPSDWSSVPPGDVSTVYPPIRGDWFEADSTLSSVMPVSCVMGRVKCMGWEGVEAMVAGPEAARVRRGRLAMGGEVTGVKVIRTLLRCCDLLFSSLARLRCSSHCCSRAIKAQS